LSGTARPSCRSYRQLSVGSNRVHKFIGVATRTGRNPTRRATVVTAMQTASQPSSGDAVHPRAVRLLFLALDLKPEEDHAECIHVKEVVRNMAALGHDILLLTSRESAWSSNGMGPRTSVRPTGGGPTVEELMNVLRETKRFRPDVIYERRFLPKISAAVSMMTGVPAVVEINGLVEDEMKMLGKERRSALPPPLREYAFSLIFRQMQRVVTVTEGLAGEMRRLYDLPLQRLVVIENAANMMLFRALDKDACRRRLGLDPESRWICFVGGLYPWHGVETAIRAMKLLAAGPSTVRLLIVGDGPRRAALEALARQLAVDDRVRFAGKVPYEEVALYISACDLGIAPLTRERNTRIGSSPMKVYEYVACGRPVVVSAVAGIGDWVEREGVGSLAEPDNPQDFADKMTKVLSDTRLLEEMPLKGPAAVARDHSWAGVAQRILTICETVARET